MLSTAKEIVRLREQAHKVAESTALAEMSSGQRVVELQRQIAELKKQDSEAQAQARVDEVAGRIAQLSASGEKSAAAALEPVLAHSVTALKEAAERSLEMARKEGELEKAKKDDSRDRKKQSAEMAKEMQNVEANVKIGAYGGDPMLNIGDATRKSEEHLSKILRVLEGHTRELRHHSALLHRAKH
jgi:hypothetical protein